MRVKSNISIQTTLDGKRYTSLVALSKARRLLKTGSGSRSGNLQKELKALYGKTGDIYEIAIAQSMGAKIIPGRGGLGVIPDNVRVTDDAYEISETKSVTTQSDSSGNVSRARPISVAGGDGITLRPGKKTFITSVNTPKPGMGLQTILDDDIKLSNSMDNLSNIFGMEDVDIRPAFIQELVNAKGNQKNLKKILSGQSKAAIAIRKNFAIKSSDIRVTIKSGDQHIVKAIGWSWSSIMRNPKAKIDIKLQEDGSIKFNIKFPEALVRAALNKANKQTDIVLHRAVDRVGKELGQMFAGLSPEVVRYLESQDFNFTTKYIKGSVLVSTGSIKITATRKKNIKKSGRNQRFISSLQWTALVQTRLGRTMEKVGPPEAPNLKERSGRFRTSIRVFPNYRARTIAYYYMPMYSHLASYGYNPDQQIETAISEVAMRLYAKAFNIVKA